MCFSECLKELTSTVDKEWNGVLSAYKHHSNTLSIDKLCVATALRPSISEQMAAFEQLNRQLQIKYPLKHAFAIHVLKFIQFHCPIQLKYFQMIQSAVVLATNWL